MRGIPPAPETDIYQESDMIYSRWGDPVTIEAFCGHHAIRGFPLPMMVVRARHEGGIVNNLVEEFYRSWSESYHSLKTSLGNSAIEDVVRDLHWGLWIAEVSRTSIIVEATVRNKVV